VSCVLCRALTFALARIVFKRYNVVHRRFGFRHQQQVSKLKYENEALKDQLEAAGRNLVAVSDSRLQLEKSLEQEKRAVQRLQRELECTRRTHAKEVICLKFHNINFYFIFIFYLYCTVITMSYQQISMDRFGHTRVTIQHIETTCKPDSDAPKTNANSCPLKRKNGFWLFLLIFFFH